MKLNKLIGIRNILVAHANDRVYAKVAYKMMKFIKASEDEDAFYNTKLKELIEETDVECPNIHFHIEELSGLKLSMSEMYAIDEIIIEEG